jgi:hypothetical protein
MEKTCDTIERWHRCAGSGRRLIPKMSESRLSAPISGSAWSKAKSKRTTETAILSAKNAASAD